MRPDDPTSAGRLPAFSLAAIALVACAVYAPAVGNLFAFDDVAIVEFNSAIHSLETLPGALVQPYWPNDSGTDFDLWRPLTTLMFGLEWIAGGGSPWLFHAVNVAGHALVAVLVALLLVELVGPGAALAGGLLFAVHPLHSETVSGVVGLSEILAASAFLGACIVHLRRRGGPTAGSALVVAALYMLGFAAKESAVTLPGALLVLDAARRRLAVRDLRAYLAEEWRVYAGMLAVAGVMLTGRWWVLGSMTAPYPAIGTEMLLEIPRIWTLGEVWMHYVRLWIAPAQLFADYSPGVIPVSTGWHAANTIGVALALGLLTLSLVVWRRTRREGDHLAGGALATGIAWFLVTISPVSNIFFLSGVLLAERTLYLPSVGLALASGWAVAAGARHRRAAAWSGLTVVVLLFAVRARTRAPEWYDTRTVLTHLIEDAPQAGRAQWIIAEGFVQNGQLSAGLRSFQLALDALGSRPGFLIDIASMLSARGEPEAARRILWVSLAHDPDWAPSWGFLARFEAEFGDAAATERAVTRARMLGWNDRSLGPLLVWAMAAQGRLAEADRIPVRLARAETERPWHWFVYLAYRARAASDEAGVRTALDLAQSAVLTVTGREALDAITRVDFAAYRPDSAGAGTGS